VFPGQLPYVECIDAVAVRVECQGKLSSWNLDGELLSTQSLSAEVHQGLVEVFARGVEK
jgi:ceramide kinase